MEKLNFENKNTNEKEPEIILHFFRHSEKESAKDKPDGEINLTSAGRKMAIEHSSDGTNISQSVAFGSPKKRTQETALYQMLGSQEEVHGEDSFEDLKAKFNEGLYIGSKVGVDKNLDFPDIETSQYKTMVYDAFKKGEYIPFLIHESDKLGIMFDSETETYSYKAAQIAKVIQKYIKISNRWDSLQRDEAKGYDEKLERFMGTHQGIQECFLAKLLEIVDGVDEREKFIQSLPPNGFDFNEGMEIRVIKDKSISIEYNGKKYQISKLVPKETIDQIADLVN